jgi:hypothetical protein
VTLNQFIIGTTYYFYVLARSDFGLSDKSNTVNQLAALTPTKPTGVTTVISGPNARTGQNVVISWTAPDPRGWAILGYRIYIRQSDSTTYSINLASCDGTTDANILANAKCTVPIAQLVAWPYSLPWGSSVFAKVVAYNGNGDSLISDAGNGAVILTYPDVPTSLTETVAARTATSITFTWTAPATNGGTPVIDYDIFYDQALLTWTPLATRIASTSYTASQLSPGLKYKFRVQARNAYGNSYDSEEKEILCATVPSKPAVPISANVAD